MRSAVKYLSCESHSFQLQIGGFKKFFAWNLSVTHQLLKLGAERRAAETAGWRIQGHGGHSADTQAWSLLRLVFSHLSASLSSESHRLCLPLCCASSATQCSSWWPPDTSQTCPVDLMERDTKWRKRDRAFLFSVTEHVKKKTSSGKTALWRAWLPAENKGVLSQTHQLFTAYNFLKQHVFKICFTVKTLAADDVILC